MSLENSGLMAASAGILFALLLFLYMTIHEKLLNRRYAQAEERILSPVFLKTNGNFNLGNGVKNGNLYFCEDGIVFVFLETRPYGLEVLSIDEIEQYRFDTARVESDTKDGRRYLITTAKAGFIREKLTQQGWIV